MSSGGKKNKENDSQADKKKTKFGTDKIIGVDNRRIMGEIVKSYANVDNSIIYSLIVRKPTPRDTECIFPKLSAHNVKAGRFENIDGVKMQIPKKGNIFYKLSDKKFIDMGWTQLPITKTLRRMNVYKMEPARPNWFEHKEDGTTLTYGNGETLASIEGHRGQWYYQNGTVALDYYNDAKDEQSKLFVKRFVIYSHEEDPTEPQSVLAYFDDVGNGVIYDINGEERLKYNQSEGQLIDPKIGPPCRWKWHSLNEPPDLENRLIDPQLENPSPELDQVMKIDRHDNLEPDTITCLENSMISLELQNKEKEQNAAGEIKYKPNAIKLKAVKINDYFSLRMFEQTNINVMFKDGDKHLKLNLGMMLISNTIIGFHVVDAFDVMIPYHIPQSSLSNITKQKKIREKLEVGGAVRQQFVLKRKFHNKKIVDADTSETYASSFKIIHLR